MSTPFLQLKNISKAFPGVQALDNVSIDVNKGEIHALLGENGAGKSTLIKLLTGVHHWDSGTVTYDGKELTSITPSQAIREYGIVPIYQELNLIPELDVAENIFLGREVLANERFRIIDRKEIVRRTTEILETLGQNISPTALVGTLGVGKQQMVEVAKALSIEARLLILDEPTASLGEDETEDLFRVMRQLKDQGVTIIFISHKLDEVLEISDRFTVLRDGKKIVTTEAEGASKEDIISYMVGRKLGDQYPKMATTQGDVALEVRGFRQRVCFQISLFQPTGARCWGWQALWEQAVQSSPGILVQIPELRPFVNGAEVQINSPKDALKHGIALLTEDRKGQGLFLGNTVLFNATVANLKRYVRRILIDVNRQKDAAAEVVRQLGIKTPGLNTMTLQLSGGNQQKVVIGKWLNTDADIFIFDEPTRGIDVGAKVEVYNIINQLIADGAAVIMISSELPEILGMSDRIIVLSEGRLTAEFSREEATQEKIMAAATGGINHAS